MVKFMAGDLMGFGLSEENIKLLKQGKPIRIKLSDFNLSMDKTKTILIFYGKTERDMRDDMAEFIGPQTIIKDSYKKS